MAVTDGVVAWVGQDRPGRALHPEAEEIPLDGAFVAPSFVDAHVHATATGLHLGGIDLSGVTDAAELLQRVRAWSAEAEPGAILLAHGWDESVWNRSRLPSRTELDEAGGGAPVYLSRIDVHSALVSSATVDLAPQARHADGWSPDGPLTGEAHHHVRRAARAAITTEQRRAAQRTFLDAAAAAGITSVHECAGPEISGEDDLAELIELAAGGPGPEVIAYWGELAGSGEGQAIDRARSLGVHGLAGDVFADGSLGSRTAALCEPYADDPGNSGVQQLEPEEIAAHIEACGSAGLQAGFHAIGDAAVTAIIDGLGLVEQRAGRRALVGGRHRMEHLEMINEDQVAELARWNVCASVQPAFDALWGGQDGMYSQRLGSARARRLNPLSMLAASGVVQAYGSDTPVTPLAPWANVHAATQHTTRELGVTPRAAFNAHTKGGYRATGLTDGLVGTLVPGAPADFAVWDVAELAAAAPDARVQRWSTDPRSRVPPLPRLESGVPMPRCMRTVRRGATIYESGS